VVTLAVFFARVAVLLAGAGLYGDPPTQFCSGGARSRFASIQLLGCALSQRVGKAFLILVLFDRKLTTGEVFLNASL